MTVDEIERAAAGFRFVGGLSLWKPAVRVRREAGVAVLWLSIEIPDSTDPTGARWQPLETGVELQPSLLRAEAKTPEQYIVDALARFVLHEMFESILVRGERLFDPHDRDAYHPGAL